LELPKAVQGLGAILPSAALFPSALSATVTSSGKEEWG